VAVVSLDLLVGSEDLRALSSLGLDSVDDSLCASWISGRSSLFTGMEADL
jgi:hypothetical protein